MSVSKFDKKLKEGGCITEACLRLVHEREGEELAEILEREDCSLERLSLRDESQCLDINIKQFFEALWSGKYSLCSLELVDCRLSEDTCTNMMVLEGPNRCRLRELILKTYISARINLSTQGMKELIRRVPMLRFFTGSFLDTATSKGVAEAIREGYCVLETLKLSILSTGNIRVIIEAIGSRVTQLRSLDFSKSRVGNKGANSLAQAIKRGYCPSLEELCLGECEIEVEGSCSLGEAIGSTVTMLRSLHLSCNIVGKRGSKILAQVITKGACVLRELYLNKAQIGSKGICSIAKALTNVHSYLHTLDLSGNQMDESDKSDNGNLFANESDYGNGIANEMNHDDDSNESDYHKWPKIMPIIEALNSNHCRLRKLILKDCGIGDEEMNVIVDGLSHTHCKLQNLEIQDNAIEDKGVQKLANALQTGQCLLQNLNLSGNPIGWEGIKQLGDALENAKSRGILKLKVVQMNTSYSYYSCFNLVEKLDCLEDLIRDLMKRDASYNSEGNVIVSLSSSIAHFLKRIW